MSSKQMTRWHAMEAKLEDTLENLNEENFTETWLRLWSINLIWCQDLLVKSLLSYSSQFHLSLDLVGKLTFKLVSYIPELGEVLVKQTILNIIECLNEKRTFEIDQFILLLAELFNLGLVDDVVILQILARLSANDVENIHYLIIILKKCGVKLKKTNPTIHDAIYQQLSDTKLEDDLLIKEMNELNELRDSNYENVKLTLSNEISNITPISFVIDDDWKEPNANLGDFEEREDMDGLELQYEQLKQKVLNDAMNKNNINEKADNDVQKVDEGGIEKDEEIEGGQQQEKEQTEIVKDRNIVKDMTNFADVEFKKKIYLLLKSSLSGDEAAHKILKLRIPDDKKFKIVDVIIRSSIQEPTYSKFYGILGEKLLNSHRTWKPAFEKIFNETYQHLDEFEPAELRIIGKFWGHLLATDYLGFEIFQIIKLNEEESTPPSRILIKFIFQELVADLNVEELKNRLNEEYIQPFLKGMFPHDEADNLRYSINYFTAIGLGVLTDEMRSKLEIIEKEEEEEEEEEHGEEEQNIEEQTELKEKTSRDIDANPFLNRDKSSTYLESNMHENNARSKVPSSNKYKRGRSRSPPRRQESNGKTLKDQGESRYNRFDNKNRYDRSKSPPRRQQGTKRYDRSRYDSRFSESSRYERPRLSPNQKDENNYKRARTPPRRRTDDERLGRSNSPVHELPPHLKAPPRYNNRYNNK